MSRVCFTTRDDGEAELRGSERAHLDFLTRGIGTARADMQAWRSCIMPVGHYLRALPLDPSRSRWVESLKTSLSGRMELRLQYKDTTIEPWEMILNTALALGNDDIWLAVAIHAQCEIHGYFEDVFDRRFAVDAIKHGRAVGSFREGAGWEDVVALFERATGPIVMSYSVTESFPAYSLVPFPSGERVKAALADVDEETARDDWWYGLSHEERWDLAMTALKANPSKMRVNRRNLRRGFGANVNAYQFMTYLGSMQHPKEDASESRSIHDLQPIE